MSQLVVKGHRGKQYKLNVTQFRSPMTATITSVQTKKMLQHFPIRAGQPDIQFTAKFASDDARHEFQAFVRDHQINAQSNAGNAADGGMVTLWWPERNIENWTGYIVEYNAIERGVREPAPSVTFGVALIDSLMSERTTISSFFSGLGATWQSIWGPQIPDYMGPITGVIDSLLRPPTPPSSSSGG